MRKLLVSFAAATLLAGGLSGPVAAQQRNDQQSAREEMRAGRNLPARDIERRIIPQMNGSEYLGFEYDRAAAAYRLKFIDKENRQVIWVDVDARNARILRISR